MNETNEMVAYYATAKEGDQSQFEARFGSERPTRGSLCNYEWNDDPWDPPIPGDVWSCTRAPGHPMPHVAEGITKIYAVHWEEQ